MITKLIDVTVDEFIKEMQALYEFEWTDDCVCFTFYKTARVEHRKMFCCYSEDSIGAWVRKNFTIKAFTVEFSRSKTFNNKNVFIDIVVNE